MSVNSSGAAPRPSVSIVRSGDLVRENRWDAGFHVIRQRLAERLRQIESTVSREDAVERLRAIPLQETAPLHRLARGTGAWSKAVRESVIKEYPHLSLAVMEGDAAKSIEALLKKRSEIDAAIAELRRLTAPSKE